MKPLRGVIAPITTPFYEGGEFAFPMLESNIERYSVTGIQGYIVLGPMGESKSLSLDEKLEAIKCVIKRMGKNQFLIAACIFESTKETVDFAKRAENLGADYIALLPPSYHKKQMGDDALTQYFTDVAMALNIPCILCNAPQFTGELCINPAVLERCFGLPNIAGIMDSSPSPGIEKLLCGVPEGFAVLSGTASSFLSALMNGSAGGAAPLANSYPVIMLDVYDAFINGDYASLQELNRRLIRLDSAVSDKHGVAAVKYAMDKNGFYGGIPRLPLLPLTDDEKAELDRAIERNN